MRFCPSKPLRVLIFSRSPHLIGGVVMYVETLKAHFGAGVVPGDFRIGLRSRRIPQPLSPFQTLFDLFRLVFRLVSRRFDAFHLNPSLNKAIVRDSLFFLILIATGYSARTLVFIHGWDQGWERRIEGSRIFRWLFSRIYRSAGMVCVLATPFREKLIAWGLHPDKVIVMTTVFDSTLFSRLAPACGRKPERLLFISRLIREKGVFEAIEAFAAIQPDFRTIRLIVAGDGPAMHAARDYAEELGVAKFIDFPGSVIGGAKADLFSRSDIMVFSSYAGEGCPIVILEAMAAGLGIVTTPVGGIPDVFEDGVNGILMNTASVEELVLALRRMLSDTSWFASVRQNNHAKAWREYEAGVAAKKIEQLYRRLVVAEKR